MLESADLLWGGNGGNWRTIKTDQRYESNISRQEHSDAVLNREGFIEAVITMQTMQQEIGQYIQNMHTAGHQ